MTVLVNQGTPMTEPQTTTFSPPAKRSQKSGYLTIPQIASLIAQAVISHRQDLVRACSSQVYATDQDEFLDFHGHQSVNENPSHNHGVPS
jgi:hypothetical protein